MSCYTSSTALTELQGITRDCKGLQGIIRDYKGLQGIARDYKGLQGITRVYKGIQGITRDLLTRIFLIFSQFYHPKMSLWTEILETVSQSNRNSR